MAGKHEIIEINLDRLNTDFVHLRLEQPGLVKKMEESLSKFGQLSPVIVRKGRSHFQIIDGFKRYYAATNLHWNTLEVNSQSVTRRAAVALILTYNRYNNSLIDYEEALILQNLKQEHRMQQDEIASLLGYSPTWVSRRLALVERLDPGVKDELSLGVITTTQAREIVKLPRGNQGEMTKTIITHGLNTRQSAVIIGEFLKTNDREQQRYILDHPLEVLEQRNKDKNGNDEYDPRLGKSGNRLLKTIKITCRQMKWLMGQVDTVKALSLIEWAIVEPELRCTLFITKDLGEIIDQIIKDTKH